MQYDVERRKICAADKAPRVTGKEIMITPFKNIFKKNEKKQPEDTGISARLKAESILFVEEDDTLSYLDYNGSPTFVFKKEDGKYWNEGST